VCEETHVGDLIFLEKPTLL